MKNYELLERIELIAEDLNFYGNLTIEILEDIFDTFAKFECNDTYAEQICYHFSDQNGAEVDDDMFDAIKEAIEEYN